jgi:hypothetical protein
MKKRICGLVLAATLSPALAQAGLWDSIATSDFPEVKPEAHYKLDVYGYDARVYEFRSQSDKNVLCVAVFSGGNTNGFQLQCVNTAGDTK